MGSPADRLTSAIEAWLRAEARAGLERARGDTDADTAMAILERHAALRGPRTIELFEDARERGLLEGDLLSASAAWLREAHAAVGRARANERVREVLARRAPHDSDHHPPAVLFERVCNEPHTGRRRAFGASLAAFAPAVLRALYDGLADVEESLEGARWLDGVALAADHMEPSTLVEPAEVSLRDTDAAWAEVLERVAHAAGVPLETWPDLFFALRAPRFDALAAPRGRYRRVAAPLAALGVVEALGKRARVEQPASTADPRTEPSVIALDVPASVHIVPGTIELGLASERAATCALGRAVALAWTHPSLPPLLARPRAASLGRALGALFAHLPADPAFRWRDGLSPREERSLRELGLALELFALRTEASRALARRHVGASSHQEAAREIVRRAWRVDVDPSIAALATIDRAAGVGLRATRFAAPLHVALRERYDEDWWRNPRAAEPIRSACARGGALSVEAWAGELGADSSALPLRMSELLR